VACIALTLFSAARFLVTFSDFLMRFPLS
jgi:hypothetical protein